MSDLIEVLARSLAISNASDPDALNGASGVVWKLYEDDVADQLAALDAAGLQIVPKEPTEHMTVLGYESVDLCTPSQSCGKSADTAASIYRAMIASAPKLTE